MLCLSPISLRDMKNQRPKKTPIEAQLKHANALILFSLEGSLAVAYHLIFACIEPLRVNCHNMCFCLLMPHQTPLFEQSPGDNAGCLFWQKSHYAFMFISFGPSGGPACHCKLTKNTICMYYRPTPCERLKDPHRLSGAQKTQSNLQQTNYDPILLAFSHCLRYLLPRPVVLMV